MRSSASASCISAIGRSNAPSSSAWSAHGIGAIRPADMPIQSVGASMPRVRASSSAVSTRNEPSRWRWSSAFGIASMRRRRACDSRSSVGVVTGRCYDSRASDARVLCTPDCGDHRSHPPPVSHIRGFLLARAWLVAVLLIALGAAGLVAGMDAPATAGARPWLTARDDVVVAGRLDAVAADLAVVSERLDALGVQGRGALAALVANDPAAAAAALDAGDGIVTDIGSRAAKIETALDDVPLVGTEEAGYRLGPAVRERHARLAAALASTRGVEASWLQLANGTAAATRLSNLLAAHDAAVLAAAEQGRDAEYEAA